MTQSRPIEKELFGSAIELADPSARTAFLDQACSGNPEVRNRLEKLLAVHASAEEFFRVSPVHLTDGAGVPHLTSSVALPHAPGPADTAGSACGTVIGRYQLLRRLGEGGCGVVYEAEQARPLRRRVALKIIRLGMDTEKVIARFEAERQTLALMAHPNIAHVLDAGATESGRPYIVMELVQGVTITDYCDQNHLGTRQRLELFIQICHAIQHAHQKGVIHRDIKPSNILVALENGTPVPKVIDFGIAKATEGRLADHTLFTAVQQFIGTPAYMSPEQADTSGLDVDTRSDIYSLGVLLYELLTGQTPFDSTKLLESGMVEMCRTLRETEPPPPSTLLTTLGNTRLAAIAAQHHAESRQLVSSLRGDLDWIVMKALEKDRRRRYETVNALATDLQRYLNHETVLARPPSRIYRLQKMLRRNRVVFAAGTAVVVALMIGLGTSTWLFLRERVALREQVRLRQAGENRQKLTQAMLLLTRDQFAAADQLIHGIPTAEVGLEYAALYRTLGDWHTVNERWQPACTRYTVLFQMGESNQWDITSLDCLRYGAALVEAGDVAGYERFRRAAIAHYATTTNPSWADRIIKISLLTPADSHILRSLDPLAELAATSLEQSGPQFNEGFAAWRAFSLALMKYRQHDDAGAVAMCETSLDFKDPDAALNASVNLVRAMAHFRLGQTDGARSELARSRTMVENYHHDNNPYGYWWDWVLARILLREATAVIKK
ncbi:MAG: serine/threonine-protein kinase [Verrucomicrobia bacterium]|nr:serine/threonine-protein kinase [Verrucomicrobiota bacterium]